MVFSSISFLIFFLPIIFILYYIIPSMKWKNGLLLIASLLFYAMGEPYYIILLLISCVFNYLFALAITKFKYKMLFLIYAILFNLGLLFFFKYTNFFLSFVSQFGITVPQFNVLLPIGISFYTFQILSYVIDVYRDSNQVQKNIFNLTLYISFFPQLIAGPIIKYHDINEQILYRQHSLEKVGYGLKRFIYGLSKKVLISNTMATIVDQVFGMNSSHYNIVITWVAAICYCLQIYYDFSGYSDMAIGLGKIFGFHFQENFMYPYSSTTVKEFWRRWHISLSSWFKEYLYIPLGGNRCSKRRTIFNKLIVFFCTGLWHGANLTFVFWGLLNGLFASLEEKGTWAKRISGHFIGWFYTSIVVIICFVLFRSESLSQAWQFYTQMIYGFHFDQVGMTLFLMNINLYFIFVFAIAIIGMFDWRKRIQAIPYIHYFQYIGSLVLFVLCLMSLASSQYNPFIYFRF